MKKVINLFLGVSLLFGLIITGCDKNEPDSNVTEEGTFKDSRDGKVYKTITIGSQTWIAENLAYVPAKKSVAGYWAYNNNENNVSTYGYLYNWETAQGIIPDGWHIPSVAEYKTALAELGDDKGLFIEKLGLVMGGSYIDNIFSGLGENGMYWVTDERSSFEHTMLEIGKEDDDGASWFVCVGCGSMNNSTGMSVLCLKD